MLFRFSFGRGRFLDEVLDKCEGVVEAIAGQPISRHCDAFGHTGQKVIVVNEGIIVPLVLHAFVGVGGALGGRAPGKNEVGKGT